MSFRLLPCRSSPSASQDSVLPNLSELSETSTKSGWMGQAPIPEDLLRLPSKTAAALCNDVRLLFPAS